MLALFNSMKRNDGILIALFFLSTACGTSHNTVTNLDSNDADYADYVDAPNDTTTTTNNESANLNSVFDSKAEFESLSNGLNAEVSFFAIHSNIPLLGSLTLERWNDQEFCRQTRSLQPNAVATYTCWKLTASDANAKETYFSMPESSRHSIVIQNFIGSSLVEVKNGNTLCQETTASQANAIPSYACFQKME